MRRGLAVAGCVLLATAACTTTEQGVPAPVTSAATSAATASPSQPSAPVVTTTSAAPAARPTGPVDKACALLTPQELEHAFGPTGLQAREQPPKGLGVAYRHSCQYVNSTVTISLDVLYARDQGGTEQKAVQDATAHRVDVEPVPDIGAAAAYFRMETGTTSGFVAAKPYGDDSVMVILLAKAADHDASKVTFAQLCALALTRIT